MEAKEIGSPTTLDTDEELDDRIVDLFCLCRMCAQDTSNDDSSCSVLPTSTLANTLQEFFNIKVKENDHLPKQICLKCLQSVNQWREVRDTVYKSQKFYQRQLQLSGLLPGQIGLDDMDIGTCEKDKAHLAENSPEEKVTILVDPDLLLDDTDTCKYSCARCLETFTNFDELITHKANHVTKPKENIKPTKKIIKEPIISYINVDSDTEPVDFDTSEVQYETDSSDACTIDISEENDSDNVPCKSDASISNTEVGEVPYPIQPNVSNKCQKEILSIKAQKVLMPNYVPILPKGLNLENYIPVKTSIKKKYKISKVQKRMKSTNNKKSKLPRTPQKILPNVPRIPFVYQANIQQASSSQASIVPGPNLSVVGKK